MNCPHCKSSNIYTCKNKTNLGYQQYRCRCCGKQYNERTGTPFNFIEYPNEVVMMALTYYYRYKLSYDDVVEIMMMRGLYLSHQTVYNWVQSLGVELGIELRKKRYKKVSDQWHVDSTYLFLEGRWCYLYRAIDKFGNLIDVYLSDVRDQAAAEAFFEQAAKTCGIYPEKITTDREPAFARAIENTFGDYTTHRNNKFMNNIIEQSHRGIKSRCRSMKGFKNIFCALTFCTVFEEIQQFFRMRNRTRAEKRGVFASRLLQLIQIPSNHP